MSFPLYSVVGTVIVLFHGHSPLFLDGVCCVVTIECTIFLLAFNAVINTINNDKR